MSHRVRPSFVRSSSALVSNGVVVVSILVGSSRMASAREELIEFFSSSFLPQAVTVEVGDTVRFQWVRGEHTVTSGSGPDDPEAGALFDVSLNAEQPAFTYRIEAPRPGGIPFFDRLRPEQQGFIEISGGEQTFRVGVVDNVFIPDELWVFAGDSVRWEHEPMEALHSVTNGTGAADPAAGKLFDEESSDARPIFVYEFLGEGIQPYFCRPHEFCGMAGTIYIQERFVRGDASGDGAVDISDSVRILTFLFLGGTRRDCADALDVNDDGTLDIGDAIFGLNHLFLGTAEIPRPYPFAGGDRTEDELRCLPGGV